MVHSYFAQILSLFSRIKKSEISQVSPLLLMILMNTTLNRSHVT